MSPLATSGPCVNTCTRLLPFMVMLFVMTFLVAGAQMPLLMVTLRCACACAGTRSLHVGGWVGEVTMRACVCGDCVCVGLLVCELSIHVYVCVCELGTCVCVCELGTCVCVCVNWVHVRVCVCV